MNPSILPLTVYYVGFILPPCYSLIARDLHQPAIQPTTAERWFRPWPSDLPLLFAFTPIFNTLTLSTPRKPKQNTMSHPAPVNIPTTANEGVDLSSDLSPTSPVDRKRMEDLLSHRAPASDLQGKGILKGELTLRGVSRGGGMVTSGDDRVCLNVSGGRSHGFGPMSRGDLDPLDLLIPSCVTLTHLSKHRIRNTLTCRRPQRRPRWQEGRAREEHARGTYLCFQFLVGPRYPRWPLPLASLAPPRGD